MALLERVTVYANEELPDRAESLAYNVIRTDAQRRYTFECSSYTVGTEWVRLHLASGNIAMIPADDVDLVVQEHDT